MSQESPHFFISPIEIVDGDRFETRLPHAIVSKFGIYRAFEESEHIFEKFLLAKIITVKIENMICLGRLVRVRGKNGSHYNIKLLHTQGEMGKILSNKLQATGIYSPRQRVYPRMSVEEFSKNLEVPKEVIITTIIGTKTARVIDFSFCGLHFEFFCAGHSLNETIGQKIHFDIMTTRKRLIQNAGARIIRIYDEMIAPGKMVRSLGVKFTSFGHEGRKIYLGIILRADLREQYEKMNIISNS